MANHIRGGEKMLKFLKNLYSLTANFLLKHRTLSITIGTAMLLISGIGAVFARIQLLCGVAFFFSGVALFCFIFSKTGKIPFIMSDNTWNSLRLKHSYEDADNRYRITMFKRATICFIPATILFFIWCIAETILFFVYNF